MMSHYSKEYVGQGRALTSEVKSEEDPVPILSAVLKREPEELNFSVQDVTGMKEEYEDQSQDLTTEIQFEEDPVPISFPMVKHEPEERNFLDHHVTGIKEEYVNQSSDLRSGVKFDEDPVPISFPVVKREPEEEKRDMGTVIEKPRIDVTGEDNEILTKRITATNLRTVSSELGRLALAENEIVREIPRNSSSLGKPVRTREDEKQLELESSKICFSTAEKLNSHLSNDLGKESFKCDVCAKCFSNSHNLKTHKRLHTEENRFRCDVCGKFYAQSYYLKAHQRVHTASKPFKCDVCGVSLFCGT
ncbi:zinc finger and SCAN domain-containing protein 2-like [Periplaneta americana]|uniref:zinc finger and SCAN domain-containing protein 2-like n=1 Tax=Periplaneta americana TaxID=6978 RepID=UPI0037E82D62